MSFIVVLGKIYFKKFCKGVQGKKLLQPPKAAKPFAFASGRAITQMDSRDATEMATKSVLLGEE